LNHPVSYDMQGYPTNVEVMFLSFCFFVVVFLVFTTFRMLN